MTNKPVSTRGSSRPADVGLLVVSVLFTRQIDKLLGRCEKCSGIAFVSQQRPRGRVQRRPRSDRRRRRRHHRRRGECKERYLKGNLALNSKGFPYINVDFLPILPFTIKFTS